KKMQKRRYWVRPLFLQRKTKGHFYTLFKFIKNQDHEQFFKYVRMTVSQFKELLELVREPLTKRSIREPLSAEHRLCLTLYYLAHGGSMLYMSKSTVSKIVQKTCKVIWEKLSPKYLPHPGTEEFLQYAQDFKETWNLPNCIGAVDGKHVTVQSPYNRGSNFFNYKKTFSVVLLAVCELCIHTGRCWSFWLSKRRRNL
ncbi:hypothetical protein ALC57_09967, partial [Trachymyrmex cornetzi]